MSQIILDVGSGNTLPDPETAVRMVDEITKYDHGKHDVVLKAQLFEEAEPNIPLDHHTFKVLRAYATTFGYKVTSSVFDVASLRFLLSQDSPEMPLPFVKIACRPDLYWLIGEVPRRIPVYVSQDHDHYGTWTHRNQQLDHILYCVRKYPAELSDYDISKWVGSVSDHTVGWDLWNSGDWVAFEKHICLERDPKNPDSGPFAILPSDLEEIL